MGCFVSGPGIEGAVIIEWPRIIPSYVTESSFVGIYDAVTGDQITTVICADIIVRTGVPRRITADLTLFCDEAGNPILNDDVWPAGAHIGPDGHMATDVYTFLVTEMRIRQ
jgi:hypothetical protein